MRFTVKKTWSQERGPSVAFRNWRSNGHCKYLHGYALGITLEFGADQLDDRGWVLDFGGMKTLKASIDELFDHKTFIEYDDPAIEDFRRLDDMGVLRMKEAHTVSIEGFARVIHRHTAEWLESNYGRRVQLLSVTVNEHTGNQATYHTEEL